MRKIMKKLILLGLLLVLCASAFFILKGWGDYRTALLEEPLEYKIRRIQEQSYYTTLEDIPEIYQNAVVAAEDHRFYDHPGVDVVAIGRALLYDIQKGGFYQGGSTITQQLAKNLYFTQEKLLSRKTAEAWMAFYLESRLTKEEILELYINICYFGEGYYGIGAASRGYFSKTPDQLTDSEATMLAGLPNAPSAYALTRHPDKALQRQRQVLEKMEEYGYISGADIDGLLYFAQG